MFPTRILHRFLAKVYI